MSEPRADDGTPERRETTARPGWTIASGIAAIAISAFTFVLVPIVVAMVAAWWLATDARSTGSRAPGALGKFALAMLAVAWAATSTLVVGFDAHFDCGGTLGGFGESANARLDADCYDRRSLRLWIVLPVVLLGVIGAGIAVRRRAGSWKETSAKARGRSPTAVALLAVGSCVVVWTAVLVVLVSV
jgi:hypothetical protein